MSSSVSDLWENWLKKTESDITPITISDSETNVVFELEGKEYRLNRSHEGWLLEANISNSASATEDLESTTFV